MRTSSVIVLFVVLSFFDLTENVNVRRGILDKLKLKKRDPKKTASQTTEGSQLESETTAALEPPVASTEGKPESPWWKETKYIAGMIAVGVILIGGSIGAFFYCRR